jgi:GDP-4-dehydro-6-deoxy-D-mannose reductase
LTNIRVLIVSTGEIYGAVLPSDIPIKETTAMRPVSPYAVSKIAQDYLSLQYHLSYHLDIIRVRPFNHIGPGQKAGYVVADFAKQIAEIEKGEREPIIHVGNLQAKRDFTDVRDMVKAYDLALQKGISGEAYNIGAGKSHEIAILLQKLLSFSSKKITVAVDQSLLRSLDVPEIRCDSTSFYQRTGWEPHIPFAKTLQDILDYWREIV